ncbi:MAG: discoidin domain-containing protein [Candidatus Omnitrophota bacterium]
MTIRKTRTFVVFIFFFLLYTFFAHAGDEAALTAPKLTNNPSLDVIVTNQRPLLSFFNASGGTGKRTYTIQIDTDHTFTGKNLITYKNVAEQNKYISGKREILHKLIEKKDSLKSKTRYHWRVRAVDEAGNKGPWAKSRFFFDAEADDSFMNLVRIPVSQVEVSSGQNPKNITDLDDPGQITFWQSTPPGSATQWVKFDLGKTRKVSRIWMLSNPQSPDGWLKDFAWQMSSDAKEWSDIKGASLKNNDTFRNIINFDTVKTRYLRLLIKDWHGYAAQINTITLYSPGKPPIPEVPKKDYVLLVGNQENGFTFSELADFVKSLNLGLETLRVPHYEVSLDMLGKLKRKPVAIILSGNNADYPNLAMFEYNGEYEIIRKSDIPILGICCGHQQLAMAYGYTYARSMGWEDISSMENAGTRAEIKKVKDDPIFEGMKDPFTAVEIHGWAVAVVPEGFELLAESSYVQAIKNTSRMIYGEQFHGEIKAPYNEGTPYIVNFLKMALERAQKEKARR